MNRLNSPANLDSSRASPGTVVSRSIDRPSQSSAIYVGAPSVPANLDSSG